MKYAFMTAVVLAACIPEITSYKRGDSVCDAGASKTCSCSGRYESVQVCADDGQSYDECRCATHLRFLAKPDALNIAGEPFVTQPVVVAEDDDGHTVSGATGFVVMAFVAGQGVLGGAKIASFDRGLASFAGLSTTSVGDKQLFASTDLFAEATESEPFSIIAGPATTLKVEGDAPTGEVGRAFDGAFVIVAHDAFGNTADGFNGVITATVLSAAPGPVGLFGITTATALGGVAVFDQVRTHGRAGTVTLEFVSEGTIATRATNVPLRQPDMHIAQWRMNDSAFANCVSTTTRGSIDIDLDQGYTLTPCTNAAGVLLGQDGLRETPTLMWSHSTSHQAIYDGVADLFWRDPVPAQSQALADARDTCEAVNDSDPISGYYWRLPTLIESFTLIEFGSPTGPRFPPKVPDVMLTPGVFQEYWTLSPADSGGVQQHVVSYALDQSHIQSLNGLNPATTASIGCIASRVASVGSPTAESDTIRYEVADETVHDKLTQLTWQRTPPAPQTWLAALSYCEDLMLDGSSDWRLPTLKELSTLLHLGKATPFISDALDSPAGHTYWSATPRFDTHCTGGTCGTGSQVLELIVARAFVMNYATRATAFEDARSNSSLARSVRCVR